ncbi:unnamed protein product [Ectocarpus sp. CCAP 1310/34]|nr:unnamed protein product [Ectocarpus sp. CCAP 1310/34]
MRHTRSFKQLTCIAIAPGPHKLREESMNTGGEARHR